MRAPDTVRVALCGEARQATEVAQLTSIQLLQHRLCLCISPSIEYPSCCLPRSGSDDQNHRICSVIAYTIELVVMTSNLGLTVYLPPIHFFECLSENISIQSILLLSSQSEVPGQKIV
jgi:hypothetical protein